MPAPDGRGVYAEGAWGPTAVGGRARRHYGRYLAVATAALAVVVLALALSLYRVAESNLDRVTMPALAEKTSPAEPINILVVGSDSRAGLSAEERRRLNLGPEYEGQRGDTVILVSISADQDDVSVVSFPRDLLVIDGDRRRKLTETFAEGPDHVVEVVQANSGVPIHHYVEVSIPGFLGVVDAIGSVRICIDYDLHDPKSGAAFDAGCHEMSPAESLAFVRSRSTPLGDFDRIARQQQFMRALLDRLVATRTVVDLPRLFAVVDRVSSHVTTDSGLGVGEMRRLAQQLRGLAEGQVPMRVIPAYTATIDDRSYVVPYEPGARAVYAALREGRRLPPTGEPEERAATGVLVWDPGAPEAADLVQRTLHWSAYGVQGVVHVDGPPPRATVVYAAPGHDERAGWVAGTLGAELTATPPGVAFPEGTQVIVVVGADAPTGTGTGEESAA